jgi:hypothetical protein
MILELLAQIATETVIYKSAEKLGLERGAIFALIAVPLGLMCFVGYLFYLALK